MKRTITLVELILAMVLLVTIILSATSLDVATRYFFRSSSLKAKVLNEASLITEHVAKNAAFAVGEGGENVSADDGNLNRRGFSVPDGNTLIIRQDLKSSDSYYTSLDTPENVTDDCCIKYTFDSASHTVIYRKYGSNDCSGSPVQTITLTDKLVGLDSGSYVTYNPSANPFQVVVHVKLRSNPASSFDPRTNPESELITSLFVH